ncbi:MAG: ATP-dependent DNA helicase [Cyanobacteria bacterium SZAS LIN-3]|nr:ATP-dependent DNA helicase [Cyanobacteria bacterium SZAS LIN-3]
MASQKNKTKKTINLAIRDFALPVPRTGSIEVNSGYAQIFGGPLTQAAEGRKIHLAVQKERQKQYAVYKSEVKLADKFESESFVFSVSGRMDGFVDGVVPMVEEIKSSSQALALAEILRNDPQHPYGLQLATYAYIVYKERAVAPRAHFAVVNDKGAIIDEFDYPFDVEVYEKWLALRLLELEHEARAEEDRRARRKKLAGELVFPFEKPRPFQRELVDNLATDLGESANIIIQAPTGLGKTIGVMYPTLTDSLSRGERFIYVTPKNSQHAVAQDAVQRLGQSLTDTQLFSTTINAKAKMCLKEEVICNPSYCQYAKDYYQKVDQAKLVDKLAKMPSLGAEEFKTVGQEYEVCPFELSLDTVQNADVVIGDYNYVFSPRNILGRLTFNLSKSNEKPNLVIDEAHNLPGRAADYYSKTLTSRELVELGSELTDLGFEIAVEGKKIVSNILFTISTVGRTVNQRDAKVALSPLLFESHLADLQALAGRYVESKAANSSAATGANKGESGKGKKRDALLTLVNLISDFSDALAYEGDEFLHLYVRSKLQDGGIEESLRVVCCDASSRLKLAHKEFAHVVAFSATIKPFDYFSQLSGLHEEDLKTREYQSPFPRDNRKLLIIPQVSTKYSDRARNYGKIAEAIKRIVAVRPGNYFVFFPSYGFLSSVFDKVKLLLPDEFRLMRQESEMSAVKAQELLTSLLARDKPTLVFAVQGGVFAEGVDYPGDMIIGAIIVGPGLPNYNFEREQIRQFYDSRYGSGFDFAYVYPAMAKVIQAAGRVIRSDQDRGIIVLMDQRFIERQYALAMPGDWFDRNASELVSRSIIQDLQDFWHPAKESTLV